MKNNKPDSLFDKVKRWSPQLVSSHDIYQKDLLTLIKELQALQRDEEKQDSQNLSDT